MKRVAAPHTRAWQSCAALGVLSCGGGGIEDVAGPTRGLRLVHGAIRIGHQLPRRACVVGIDADANARRHHELQLVDRVRRAYALQNSARRRRSILGVTDFGKET